MREFLETQWKADLSRDDTVALAVKSLLEVVQSGEQNIDLVLMDGFGSVRVRRFVLSLQAPGRRGLYAHAFDSMRSN